MTIDHLLSERRHCYHIPVGQNPQRHNGYVPALVIEGEPGYWLMCGEGKRAPWIWGSTLEIAMKVCADYNRDHFGFDQLEVDKIIASTMRKTQ